VSGWRISAFVFGTLGWICLLLWVGLSVDHFLNSLDRIEKRVDALEEASRMTSPFLQVYLPRCDQKLEPGIVPLLAICVDGNGDLHRWQSGAK
jgi:hypothetical protein